MKASDSKRSSPLLEITFYAIILLFFFQLLSDFVEAIYAFGLLGTSIPIEIVSVLLLFTPLLLLVLPASTAERSFRLLGGLMLASRVIEVMLDTRGRMILSGVGVGSFLLLFPLLLLGQSRRKGDQALRLAAGLALAVSLSILLRALGSGSDLSTLGMFKLIGWILAAVGGYLLVRLPLGLMEPGRGAPKRHTGADLGAAAALVLLYFAFTSPNVIARWTGVSYTWIQVTLAVSLIIFALLLTNPRRLLSRLSPGLLRGLNVLFVAALVGTVLVNQVSFSSDASGYPLPEPAGNWFAQILPFITLLLLPILLLDFWLLAAGTLESRPSMRSLGRSFALASLFLIVMIFGHVFTTVYDYIPVVGPFFRDKFWLVHLVPGLVLLAAVWPRTSATLTSQPIVGSHLLRLLTSAGLLTVAGVLATTPRLATPEAASAGLRVLTYNIQQGYSADGLRNFDGQLALMRDVDADIIALQESDTNRIAGGNADVVRYFADRLEMHSYYGPKTVPGTFGIALLSRYPIDNPQTFYMYSEGEQTATIEAQVTVAGKTYTLFITHLGNGGPIVQQEALLQEAAGKRNVIMMGDFNFRPDTDQYRLTTASWQDGWLQRWPEGVDDQGANPERRIDHIFLSSDLIVDDIRYLDGPQSDHPAVMADLR